MSTGPMRIGVKNEAPGAAAQDGFLLGADDRILVTGAAGFIGARVVKALLARGFRNIACFTRPSSETAELEALREGLPPGARMDMLRGNLLARTDCEAACEGAALILHLAAGTGEKSFPDAFMNSVVTTRNLLEASQRRAQLRRFVLVSSFAVYTNQQKAGRLDESCPIEEHPETRDAYCFAKVKQEQIVAEYGQRFGIPYTIVRPGSVYGEGAAGITGRVGLGTFGIFLHLGGANRIPFTYVDNCADAIVLAGIVAGAEGEAFNVVDDDLPTSRQFLRGYRKSVRRFGSVYVPHAVSRVLCDLWEAYSRWSHGQLPPVFGRKRWYSEWRKTSYSNQKLKARLGWRPQVPTREGLERYFAGCREALRNA